MDAEESPEASVRDEVSGPALAEGAPVSAGVERNESEWQEEEYDAEAVASLLWPDDAADQREWIDGPIDHVLSYEPDSSSPSARRRSSGLIVDALVDAIAPDETQTVECDAIRTQAEQEEQRRQLDALELQLASLEAQKRVLCSELGPARTTKPRDEPNPSRLRVAATSVECSDGELVNDGPANPPPTSASSVNRLDGAHAQKPLGTPPHPTHPARRADPRRVQNCPSAFICPITQDIFRFPVIASDGHSYEREAIETWLVSTNVAPTSPVTNLPLPTTALFPNHGLRSQVLEWRQKEGLPQDDCTTGADSGQSEKGYAGLMEPRSSRSIALADTDTEDTDDTDDDPDPFDLALSEALRRSLLDQHAQMPGQVASSTMWHSQRREPPETSHVADLMRARRARGLRPAGSSWFGTDTTGSPTLPGGNIAWGGGDINDTRRRSSACNVM